MCNCKKKKSSISDLKKKFDKLKRKTKELEKDLQSVLNEQKDDSPDLFFKD